MLERLASHWWLFLIRGLLALAFGVLALVYPIAAVWTIAVLFGAYAFVDGIFAIAAAVRMRHADSRWTWLLVEGVLGILVGVITFFAPGVTALTLALLLGAWAIVTGVLAVASAFDTRRHVPNEWLWVLAGIVSIVFGILVFFSPAYGLFALVWMVSFYAILAGVLLIGFAFRLRGLSSRHGLAV